MEFGDVVRRRRRVRSYRPDPVDAAAVDRVLDVARRGPSAGWTQSVSFVVVTAARTRAGVAALCNEDAYVARGFDPWLSRAPVHVVVCVSPQDYRMRYAAPDKIASAGPAGWEVPFWWVDAGAAVMLLSLAAVDEGLAAGFLDVADRAGLRRLLAIPREVAVVGLATLGHPSAEQRPSASLARGRRPLGDVVHRDRW